MRLGTAGPFGPAARLLAHFTGVTMSPATLRRLTLGAGDTLRRLECEVSASVRERGGIGAPVPDGPLQLSVDGSMVHLREEGWREVKLAAIGVRQTDGPLTDLSYTATLGTAEAFGDEALGELGRRGIPMATDVVTVNDGADWIQGIVDLHCPQAVRVLDFAHAAGYLASAATAAHGEGTLAASGWFTAQRRELREGDPDRVLAALETLPAGEERDRARAYLTRRRAQIAYREFVARGWPIGSGCVESAHKGIVQERLKRRGMRWSRPVAEGLLALRIVDANDRWAATWARVGPHQRATQHRRAAARRVARRLALPTPVPAKTPEVLPFGPAIPTPKLVVNGKPTAAHPWRQFRLTGSAPAAKT